MRKNHKPGRRFAEIGPEKAKLKRGFALVVTLVLMVLLTLIAVGLLSLSTVALRSSATDREMTIARANARMALMIAIGELQEAMGPDTRISASASILDTNAATPGIDGVKNPHLLGVWESWGGWLNAEAQDPKGGSLTIKDTYASTGRPQMFRKWLVSSNAGEKEDIAFAKNTTLDDDNSVVLVGKGSVIDTQDYVRARIVDLDGNRQNGRIAWWIGGENQKADITQNQQKPTLAPAKAELAHGDASSRDMSELTGLAGVTRDEETANKLVTTRTLESAGATTTALAEGFHDFTSNSLALMTDTRWGGLKKDLSLLFDQPALPAEFTRNASTAYSPRPLSADLLAFNPKIPQRGFTSFEQMHAFARLHKNSLKWAGAAPTAPTAAFGHDLNKAEPQGFYRRMPVISKFYSIYNLQTKKVGVNGNREDIYDCYLTYSPIVQLWNPYNTPLEIDQRIQIHTLPYKILPIRFKTYKKDQQYVESGFLHRNGWIGVDQAGFNLSNLGGDYKSPFQDSRGSARFTMAPGEIKIFSFKTRHDGGLGTTQEPFRPGFDPGAAGSARLRVLQNVTVADRPSIAIQTQPYWDRANAQWFGGNPGGLSIVMDYGAEVHSSSGLNIDWSAEPRSPGPDAPELKRQDYLSISPDLSNSVRARWIFSDPEPSPIGVFGAVLKTAADLQYDTIDWNKDWRNKPWIHSSPGGNAEQMLASYTDSTLLSLQRMNAAYQIHIETVSGAAELSSLIGHSGERGFLGGVQAPISSVAVYEVPTAPVQSLAGFSGLRLQPGWYDWSGLEVSQIRNVKQDWPHKISAYKSGVPSLGVGNSFAVPMIAGDKVYQYHNVSVGNPESQIDIIGPPALQDNLAFSDFWDHQLLVNDGLWDSFYSSSLADSKRASDSGAADLSDLLDRVFKDSEPLPNANFVALGGKSATDAIADLKAADGYLRSAMYLGTQGAFNVNSTSIDAWYSLFTGLREHNAVYRNASGQLENIPVPAGKALVTRFNTETAAVETTDPTAGEMVNGASSWTGVRFLEDDQLRVLAEKCVEQVKRRGPFLNMSDFVNRRLSTDDLGVRGALQAAIDYDDQSPDAKSINRRFKDSSLMVKSNTSIYPFPKAAEGSMYSGIPGYVVQSDILKPLGNSLVVRDDTFRIRTYGEATDSTGKVLARAHCEAIVQRTIDYVDSVANDPTVPAIQVDQNGNVVEKNGKPDTELSLANQRFGRRFKIVSFRWLSASEI